MVSNQNEFNNEYSKEIKEIEVEYEDFTGELVIEGYSNLEKLYLRDVDSINKIVLKNLLQLQLCDIWNCELTDLVIDNCPQIKKLNVRQNLLTNLEFLKGLENLEKLEADNNAEISSGLEYLPDSLETFSYENTKLTEILNPYGNDWRSCKNKILIKELETSRQKYNNLKSFLKGILVSLSKETQQELANKLGKEIEGEKEGNSDNKLVTRELKNTELLKFNVEEVVANAKELKEELEKELNKSEAKIQALEQELAEAQARIEEREKKIKRLSQQEQNLGLQSPIYEKTLDFLRTKSTFLNARQQTIKELKKCFIALENKFGKHDVIGSVGEAISKAAGSGALDALVFSIPRITGEVIKVGNTFSKLNLIAKSSKEFQISLSEEEELSRLDNVYNSLIELIRKNSPDTDILNLKGRVSARTGKVRFFNINYETLDVLNEEGIWRDRNLTPEKMETAIISLSRNFKELEAEWEREFAKLKNRLGEETANLFAREHHLKTQIHRLQGQLEELIIVAKDKLKSTHWREKEKRNKERETKLNDLLNMKAEIIHSGNITNEQRKITSLQNELLDIANEHGHKEFKTELENLCQVQIELTKLQIELVRLQEKQAQVQIPPK